MSIFVNARRHEETHHIQCAYTNKLYLVLKYVLGDLVTGRQPGDTFLSTPVLHVAPKCPGYHRFRY